MSQLGSEVSGYILQVARSGGQATRIELALGPLPLGLEVGEDITLTKYGAAFPSGPNPNHAIAREGTVVVYVAQSRSPFAEEQPLPVSLGLGKVTCEDASYCGYVKRHDVVATAGDESVEIVSGTWARVGAFQVYSTGDREAEPNDRCGDYGGSVINVAWIRDRDSN